MSREERKNELMKMHQANSIESLTEVEMPKSWKISEKGKEAIRYALAMTHTKHGLYASIPMLCKASKCHYAKVCPLVEMDKAPEGERCPLEIGIILTKFEQYKQEFGLDENNIVDMGLVKDLIDCDIQIFRAENKIAVDGDFIEEVPMSVTESGEVITQPQLSKATEYKDKILNKKFKILELMHATRKDKAQDKMVAKLDPSTYAAQLMAQVAKSSGGPVIDAEFEDMEDNHEDSA